MHVNQTESVLLLYIVPFGENKWVAKISALVQLHTCYTRELTLLLSCHCYTNNIRKHSHTHSHPINGLSSYVFGSLRLTEIALTLVAVGFFSTSGCSSEMLVIEHISFSGCDVICTCIYFVQKQMVEWASQQSMSVMRVFTLTHSFQKVKKKHQPYIDNRIYGWKCIHLTQANSTTPVKIQFIYLILLQN